MNEFMFSKSQKIEFVKKMQQEINNYSTIGLVQIQNIPDKLLQKSKNSFKKDTKIIFARKKILLRVLEKEAKLKPLFDELKNNKVQYVILLTNDSSFEIFKKFKSNSLKLFAKPNQKSIEDILIKSGETSIQPGQTVTELKQAGINVQIQKGKVVIGTDKIIRKDEVITPQISKVLRILDIKPFTVSIIPNLIFYQDLLFNREVLNINKDKIVNDMIKSFNSALAICLQKNIINKYTISTFVAKAYNNAIYLGLKAQLYEKGIIEKLLLNAFINTITLNNSINSQ